MRSAAEPDSASADPGAARPRAADFLATNRGGGLYSEALSQRLGAWIAVAADRLRVPPTVLTLVNLLFGVGASLAVVVLAPAAASGALPAWGLGLAALIGWQVAYAFDCADGQLARVTGQSSPSGARLDVLADVAVQISLVTAVSSAALAYRPDTPVWLVSIFAGTWMVNLVTSVMQSGSAAASMVTSTSLPVRLVKLVRDYGAVIALCGLVLTLAPAGAVWVMWAFSIVNGLFLAASVAHSARNALR